MSSRADAFAALRAGAEQARLTSSNHAAANGAWRNVAVSVGHKPPDKPAAMDYWNNLADVIGRHPEGVALVTVIKSTSTPKPEARDTMVRMFRELWQHILCAAFVVEGKGFTAAAQRGVISALLMSTGLGGRIKIFGTVREATAWVATQLVPTERRADVQAFSATLNEVVLDFVEQHGGDPSLAPTA